MAVIDLPWWFVFVLVGASAPWWAGLALLGACIPPRARWWWRAVGFLAGAVVSLVAHDALVARLWDALGPGIFGMRASEVLMVGVNAAAAAVAAWVVARRRWAGLRPPDHETREGSLPCGQ